MNPLLLNRSVHKILISSSARFTGEFHSEDICLDLCFPTDVGFIHTLNEHPANRTFIVVSLFHEHDGSMILPDLYESGDHICSLLSVLFGKEFKSHGLLESNGNFRLPIIENSFNTYYLHPQYNHNVRADLNIPLNLGRFELIAPLLRNREGDAEFSDFQHIIFAALMFYKRSLNIYLEEKELAFLDLITCGEILSNLDSERYSDEELYDPDLLSAFQRISTLEGGDAIVRSLKNRLYQVKRKFTYGLLKLLNDNFFENTEVLNPEMDNAKLSRDNIETTLRSAYDLRSIYVHSGIDFGKYIESESRFSNERVMGTPQHQNTSLMRVLRNVPTFLGLERVLRFTLLKAIHEHHIFINDELE